MANNRITTSIGTFVKYESPEIIDEEKALSTEKENEEKIQSYFSDLQIGVDTRNKASKISYFTRDDLDLRDAEKVVDPELPYKRGIGMTRDDFVNLILESDPNALPMDKSTKKSVTKRDKLEAIKTYLTNNKGVSTFLGISLVSALSLGIITGIDIHNGPVKIIPENGITIDRIVECITEEGPTSLNELALSAHTSPNAILYKNGLKTMDEALGKRIRVPYTFEKGDPLYTYSIGLVEGKTYETMELYRLAHSFGVSLQTLRDLNKDNSYEHNNGLRFEHDRLIVPCFPTKEAQVFIAKK